MLVTVSFNINDKQKIMDIMHIPQRRYDMFCSGTLESVVSNCGVNCSKCQKRLNSHKSETREDLLLIYALESKAATMKMFHILKKTGVARVQTTLSLASFFESRQLLCTKCSEPKDLTANQKPSTSKVVKKEPLLCIERIKLEEPQVVESGESNSLQVNNSYESDAEVSEFSTPANKDRLILTANSDGEEQCQVCQKILKVALGRKYNMNMTFRMRSHSRVHLETLPYTCRVCGYECRYGSMMKSHCRRRHGSANYNDYTGDLGYIEELKTMTKQCFPEWKIVTRKESWKTSRSAFYTVIRNALFDTNHLEVIFKSDIDRALTLTDIISRIERTMMRIPKTDKNIYLCRLCNKRLWLKKQLCLQRELLGYNHRSHLFCLSEQMKKLPVL